MREYDDESMMMAWNEREDVLYLNISLLERIYVVGEEN